MFECVERERVKSFLREELTCIEKALKEERVSQHDFIRDVSEYVLFSGGKRVRPLLFVLSAKLCSPKYVQALNIDLYRTSLLFEYLHTATLLHDDVVDSAEFRRGRRAARNLWGNQATILVGDYLYAKALRIASELRLPDVMEVITETALLMSEGEVMQLLNFDKLNLTERAYFEVVFRKTAVLMSACCEVGAIIDGASAKERELMRDFGRDLGFSFQIVDDLLDYTSNDTGKDLGRDFFQGKVTLPVVLALKQADDSLRKELVRLFTMDNPTKEDFSRARELIARAGGFDLAKEQAKTLLAKTKEILNNFQDGIVKSALSFIADYILERRL